MWTSIPLAALVMCIAYVNADMYLSNPRGSNNRLNEASANRNNANRVFDSQNNNRGGYNVGDKTDAKAGNNENLQYQMEYFMSGATKDDATKLLVEWTNQHGCGGNEDTDPSKLNCDIIIQYTMPDEKEDAAYDSTGKFSFRDGTTTNTQNYNAPGSQVKDGVRRFTETKGTYANRKNGNVQANRVYQEPHEWHDKCRARSRNKGLFTADQNLNDNIGATATRQNPNGNRRGYECAEERDYYPYWHPTSWRDIVIFTKRTDKCDFFKKESFNVKPKGECVQNWPGTNQHRHYSGAETPENCEKVGGKWHDFYNYLEINPTKTTEAACNALPGHKWAIPYRNAADNRLQEKCLVLLKAPECKPSPFSRHNHLGNGVDLEALRYEWNLPNFSHETSKKFVLRIRYNISTDDYDPYNTDSKFNGEEKSPVTNDPLVDVGSAHPMRLAINTAQFGRTFQDRTHVSFFTKRPTEIASGTIYNLNVRGKRGNIVQTFPAVEYDFIPNDLTIKQADMVHFQWTGSNSHNNGNPAGDGQAGDAGQGTGGTDRSNIVGLGVLDDNFPQLMEDKDNMCHHMDVLWEKEGKKAKQWYDICLKLGSSGYYDCKSGCTNALDTKTQMNNLLNNAPASFSGMVVKFKSKKTFHYTCTRNNNFTNRSQKGTIKVE